VKVAGITGNSQPATIGNRQTTGSIKPKLVLRAASGVIAAAGTCQKQAAVRETVKL
jgi:hypothetical protein